MSFPIEIAHQVASDMTPEKYRDNEAEMTRMPEPFSGQQVGKGNGNYQECKCVEDEDDVQ